MKELNQRDMATSRVRHVELAAQGNTLKVMGRCIGIVRI